MGFTSSTNLSSFHHFQIMPTAQICLCPSFSSKTKSLWVIAAESTSEGLLLSSTSYFSSTIPIISPSRLSIIFSIIFPFISQMPLGNFKRTPWEFQKTMAISIHFHFLEIPSENFKKKPLPCFSILFSVVF